MTDKEIENQMNRALDKLPFEIKKIKFFLFFLKKWKNLLKIFK